MSPGASRTCLAAVWACALYLGVASCGPTVRPDFDSPEPAARNAAIVRAAAKREQASVPRIVPLLESDDPATRVLAIRALERITGQTLGYDPASSEAERSAAVERWAQFARGSVQNGS